MAVSQKEVASRPKKCRYTILAYTFSLEPYPAFGEFMMPLRSTNLLQENDLNCNLKLNFLSTSASAYDTRGDMYKLIPIYCKYEFKHHFTNR